MLSKIKISLSDFLSKRHWLNIVLTKETFDNFFAALGKLWLVVSLLRFFFPVFNAYLNNHVYILLILLLLIATWIRAPLFIR